MVSSRFALEIAFFSFQYQNSHQVTMQGDLVWLSAVVQIITVMSSARGRGGMPARAEGDCHGRVCLTGCNRPWPPHAPRHSLPPAFSFHLGSNKTLEQILFYYYFTAIKYYSRTSLLVEGNDAQSCPQLVFFAIEYWQVDEIYRKPRPIYMNSCRVHPWQRANQAS